MKLTKIFVLLILVFLFALSSSCQSSEASNESAEAQVKPSAVVNRSSPTRTGTPPSEVLTREVRKSGQKWVLQESRTSPVSCNFTIYIDGQNADSLRLIGVYASENFLADKVKRGSDGGYTFRKEGGYMGGLYFAFLGPNQFLQLLIDEDQEFTLRTHVNDLIGNMQVEGSLDNELLYQNMNFEGSLQPKFKAAEDEMGRAGKGTAFYAEAEAKQDALIAERKKHIHDIVQKHPNSFFAKFKVAGQNPDLEPPLLPNGEIDNPLYFYQYREAFWEGVDFGDVRLLRTPVLHNKLERYLKDLTPRIADSVAISADKISEMALYGHPEVFKHFVNYIGVNYKKSDLMGGESAFVLVVDKYFTQKYAFWEDSINLVRLRDDAHLMKASLLGKTGQDVRAKDRKGQYQSLYEIQSPVTVVFIYSAECEHCQEETPKLKKVYQEWKDKGLAIYGICQDQDMELWEGFLDQFQLPWVNVIDPSYESRYYQKYHMDVLPELYVMDKDWKIIAKNIKPEQLPIFLKKELGEE